MTLTILLSTIYICKSKTKAWALHYSTLTVMVAETTQKKFNLFFQFCNSAMKITGNNTIVSKLIKSLSNNTNFVYLFDTFECYNVTSTFIMLV